MHLLAAVGDVLVAHLELLGLLLRVHRRHVRLGGLLARDERVVCPLLEDRLDAAHVVLHRGQRHVRLGDQAHHLVDEGGLLLVGGAPRELLQPLLEQLVDGLHLPLEQRLLDVEHRGEHLVVLVLDDLEVAPLHAELLGARVQVGGHLGDVLALDDEVLDLGEQLDEQRVEVDRELPRSALAREEGQGELLRGGGLDRVAPLAVQLGLEVGEARRDALVQPLHVLGLVRLLHRLEHHLEAAVRLVHARHEALHPGEGARDRRHVDEEGRALALVKLAGHRAVPVAAEELLHLLEALAVLEDELQVLRLDVRGDEVAQQQLAWLGVRLRLRPEPLCPLPRPSP